MTIYRMWIQNVACKIMVLTQTLYIRHNSIIFMTTSFLYLMVNYCNVFGATHVTVPLYKVEITDNEEQNKF